MSTEIKNEKKKGTLIKDALILFAITLIAALALGAVYEITKDPIAKANEQAKVDAANAVFPAMKSMEAPSESAEAAGTEENIAQTNVIGDSAMYEGVSVEEISFACDEAGECIGCILTMKSTKGYGGPITMMMGVANDGTLQGIEFLSISETAGLGMKAKDDAFKSQFSNVKTDSFSLEKKGIAGSTEVDAISSATITTTAVTRMVNAGLKVASYELGQRNCRKGGTD